MDNQHLSKEQTESILWNNFDFLVSKGRTNIKTQLGKWVPLDEVSDVVTELLIDVVDKVRNDVKKFSSEQEIINYLLPSIWRNYRDSKVTSKTKRPVYLRGDERESEVRLAEGYQTFIHAPSFDRTRTKEVSLETLRRDNSDDGEISFEFLSELEDHGTLLETQQDRLESYHAALFSRFVTYLEDAVADGVFTFKEVSIYKDYILNGRTKKELIRTSDFSKSVCNAAIKKVEEHLETVDWRLRDFRESE